MLPLISLLVNTALAIPVLETLAPTCTLTGTRGVVPQQTKSIARLGNIKTAEGCRKECYSVKYAACKSFAVRFSGGGSCVLFDFDVTPVVIPREDSNVLYYPLPTGIIGAVPENVAQHYFADTTKKNGNYAGCREVCLGDSRCKGFGYKEGGNCQLYDVSLAGKVKHKAGWPYIQYQVDCTATEPVAQAPTTGVQLPNSGPVDGGEPGVIQAKKVA